MYQGEKYISNRDVIAHNLQSSYVPLPDQNPLKAIQIAKSLETEAFSMFEKGEVSSDELDQILIYGQLSNNIEKSNDVIEDGTISLNGLFILKGLTWQPFNERLEMYKSLGEEIVDFIEKGKGAQIGEIRTWGGERYVKHTDGWVHVHKKTGKVSVLPTSGTVRKIDGNDDHKVHYDVHTTKQPGDEIYHKNENTGVLHTMNVTELQRKAAAKEKENTSEEKPKEDKNYDPNYDTAYAYARSAGSDHDTAHAYATKQGKFANKISKRGSDPKTSSGKSISNAYKDGSHKDFTLNDHQEARDYHRNQYNKLKDKPGKENEDKANEHRANYTAHMNDAKAKQSVPKP